MLHRQLEPEVMDAPEDASDYDTMDHSAVNQSFVNDLLVPGELCGEVLDMGVGTAQIPVEICRRCKSCHVLGIDLAENMLQLASHRVTKEKLQDRLTLERQDAKCLSFVNHRFDAVISNSIVHHLAEPQQVFAEAIRVVSTNGLLFFRDLLRPADEATLQQLVATYVSSETNHAQQLFEDSLRAALMLEEVRAIVVAFGFESKTVQTTSDRHWTWIARANARQNNPVVH